MPPCHPFRPVPGQCGPNRRGPLPAPPFDPRDYWATRKCVSELSASLETKLDKADVVDPGAATEAGQAADAKGTYEELGRILTKLAKKADKATTLAGYGITDAATKTEIAAKADLVGGKVPAAQLPSYVDDVLEYDTMSAFPATGESGKIYITKDANKTYRWSGTQYVEISTSPVLDDTVTEESPNGVKSSGIWSWVKSLLPKWLTSDYAEPATVASVATKADKTALGDKRDKDDLAVYEKVGVGEWTFSVTPSLLEGERVEISYQVREWSIQFLDEGGHYIGHSNVAGKETDFSIATTPVDLVRPEGIEVASFTATRSYQLRPVSPADFLAKVSQLDGKLDNTGGTVRGDFKVELPDYGGTILSVAKGLVSIADGQTRFFGSGGQLIFDRNGFETIQTFDEHGNLVTLIHFLDSLAWRTTGNRTLSDYGITDGATKASLAPEYSATSAYSVGAIVYYGGNIYQCKTAIAEGGEAWDAEHWELRKLYDFFTESNSLLTGTIDARLPYPLHFVTDEPGLLKDRAINTTSLDAVTVPDNFTDLLVRASVASSLSVTMPEAIVTKYGDTFPGEAGEYLITITKTGAAEAYVRTIKLEEVA